MRGGGGGRPSKERACLRPFAECVGVPNICEVNRLPLVAKHSLSFEGLSLSLSTTVEPLRKGRFGEMAYVPCREIVPILEVCLFFIVSTLIHVCFQYNELFSYSRG